MKIPVRTVVIVLTIVSSLITACSAPSSPTVPTQPTTTPIAVAPTNAPEATTVPAPTNPAPTSAPAQTKAAAPTDAPTVVAPTEANVATAPPPTAAPAPTQQGLGDYFGISTNGEVIFNDSVRALAILSGARIVRTSVTWQQVEPTPGKFNWSYPDKAFQILKDNNLEPYVLIMDNSDWGASTRCGPVSDLLAYDRFLRALAARYPHVKYWGLYNEPDNAHGEAHSTGGCFGGEDLDGNGKPDYEDFAIQLQMAWRAIHAGNPDAELVVGAIAYDNFDEATAPPGYPGAGKGGIFDSRFVDNLFGYMQANPPPPGEKYFDYLGFNYYNIYAPFWEAQTGGKGVGAKASALNRKLEQYGLDAPLFVSETGTDSVVNGDAAQSAFLVKTFARGAGSNIAHMVWWTFQDFSDSAPPPSNTWKYGLIDQTPSPKPSYGAYQTIVKMLGDAKFVQPLSVGGGEGYLYDKGGAGVAVVWSSSESPIAVPFAGNVLVVTDMYGSTRTVSDGSGDDKDAASGRIAVQIDQNPIYVQTAQ